MTKDDQLFNQGIAAFNKRQFYDAHEYWEELWLEYKLDDAKFSNRGQGSQSSKLA